MPRTTNETEREYRLRIGDAAYQKEQADAAAAARAQAPPRWSAPPPPPPPSSSAPRSASPSEDEDPPRARPSNPPPAKKVEVNVLKMARDLIGMSVGDPETPSAATKAFRTKIVKERLHPDQGGNAERFAEVSKAHDILKKFYGRLEERRAKDPKRAEALDRLRAEATARTVATGRTAAAPSSMPPPVRVWSGPKVAPSRSTTHPPAPSANFQQASAPPPPAPAPPPIAFVKRPDETLREFNARVARGGT